MIRLPIALRPMFAVLVSLLAAMPDARAGESYLPPIGGGGGAQFIEKCIGSPEEYGNPLEKQAAKLSGPQNLAGFELRAGDDIDAIRPLCVSAYSTGSVTAPELTRGSGLIGRDTGMSAFNGFVKLPPGWHGGIGGGLAKVVCPHDRPIVVGMYVAAEGVDTVTINNIHLFCGEAVALKPLDENPSAIFDAPKASGSPAVLGIGGTSVSNTSAFQRCPEGQVAIGVHGRSGEWVDAIGLICDAPRIIKAMALGRVEARGPTDPGKTICDYAKSARARNSPAAPALEKRCAEEGQTQVPDSSPSRNFSEVQNDHSAAAVLLQPDAPKALGRTQAPAGTPAAPPQTICEMAASARAAGRPTAAALQQRCDAELAANAAAAPAPAPAGAPTPPVRGPHDLIVGRISYAQDGQRVAQPVVGKPVAIACNYFVNEAAGPFVFTIQPWQGLILIGGRAPQTITFQGDPRGGPHEARQIWTPAVAGNTPISCILNPGFEAAEANSGNNRFSETIDVVAGDDAAPPAQ